VNLILSPVFSGHEDLRPEKNPVKIVFVASEMVPFVKTGGLADVIGSLASAIRALGHEVSVFLPRYKQVDAQKLRLETVVERIDVTVGNDRESASILQRVMDDGVRVFFVDHPGYFNREALYGTASGDYSDNDRRFAFFQRAVLEALKALPLKPDVIHCHDWQTGLLPVYLKTLYAGQGLFHKTRTVFTIHNLAYQGLFPPDSLPATGLGWEQFRMERLEFYGKFSFLKGGILDADVLTTVSERYSQEIQTKEFGCGLEGVLIKRKASLHGVVNGIDPAEWDPEKDPDLAATFNAQKIERKAVNKQFVQKENGLAADPKTPLLGVVSRLVDQKGIDILIPALDGILAEGAQIVVLGTGEERYHHALRDIAKKNKGRVAAHITFDAKMAKRIYAGADMMLMPSHFEPCGLGQMISLRYGTVPVVRATGGLADTVKEFDARSGEGNGFIFTSYTTDALLAAVRRAVAVYRSEQKWAGLVQNAMASDFSWTASAKRYERLYEKAIKKSLQV
jgi:starch synthase